MSISAVFGLPGSGKSVFLTKCVLDALNHKPTIVGGSVLQDGNYSQILTNFQVDGCKILEWDKLGKAEIRDTLIVCDEIMIYADSRKFKTFTDDLTFFFSQHRKFGITFLWASQTYRDCDLRIRNLTERFYFCKPAPIFSSKFSVISPIVSGMAVKNGEIAESYTLAPPMQRKILYLPKYWNKFNSYQIITKKPLQQYQFRDWETFSDVPRETFSGVSC